jgi:hypothetical protein
MSDEDWAERVRRVVEEAEANTRKRMAATADLLASEQRFDELRAKAEAEPDPFARAQLLTWAEQARHNTLVLHSLNEQADFMSQLGVAVVVLADAVRRLEDEVRALGGDS